jgi:hypothetical protein
MLEIDDQVVAVELEVLENLQELLLEVILQVH